MRAAIVQLQAAQRPEVVRPGRGGGQEQAPSVPKHKRQRKRRDRGQGKQAEEEVEAPVPMAVDELQEVGAPAEASAEVAGGGCTAAA